MEWRSIDGSGNHAQDATRNAQGDALVRLAPARYADAGRGLAGGLGAQTLAGAAGADTLSGGAGEDLLLGGAGADRLRGGRGADLSRFESLAEIGRGERIRDFAPGEDRIDLSGIGPFGWRGAAAFTGGGGAEARFDARPGGGVLLLDADGDGWAEAVLRLPGVAALSAGDILT